MIKASINVAINFLFFFRIFIILTICFVIVTIVIITINPITFLLGIIVLIYIAFFQRSTKSGPKVLDFRRFSALSHGPG